MAEVVFFWQGGTEVGKWREALPGVWPDRKTADQLVAELNRAGFVAHKGSQEIGAPEGPPAADEISAVLAVR